jgi:2-C-methyl-D-erythritol 2,4-cyclodiphosphate synthase
VAELLSIDLSCVGVKAKTPEGLHQDDVAVAHAVVLLKKLDDGNALESMAAVAAEPQKQMDDVVRKLVERTDVVPLRKPTFNTDDIT